MRDLTKEHQAASGRRLHAFIPRFACSLMSAAAFTALTALPAVAADLAVTTAQQAEAQRSARQGIPVADLAADAPSQYSVRAGDTLWGISGRFLRQPWRWPELWGMNQQQIRNPHLIYPGQILYLVQRDGRAWLSTAPGSGDTVRLSPQMRSGATEGAAILSIPAADIEPFLIRPLVVDQGTLDTSARIVAVSESRVILGRDDTGYARGIPADAPPGSDWQAYRPATPVRDPVTQAVLGYEAEYEGNVRLARGAQGPDAVSTLQVTQARQEMGVGTMLMPQPAREALRYVPHAPDAQLDGRVAKVYGGVEFGGARQVVVLNLGSQAGVEPGHVLALSRTGETVADKTDSNRAIRLPDERYGLAFVFRVFPGVSYALVTDASNVITVGDRATSPH
ncbi:LysM peptidoglycan-binding domain-containing protein [Cupriavidus necator]|uniref:LysM peptidoglycan-binding domain-containing protein n=1 Tax=Cupriavidus necator TaxID=106590 RepID=UPI0027D8D757|nr:LysM domain-containing protein [Cupriavidus necator]